MRKITQLSAPNAAIAVRSIIRPRARPKLTRDVPRSVRAIIKLTELPVFGNREEKKPSRAGARGNNDVVYLNINSACLFRGATASFIDSTAFFRDITRHIHVERRGKPNGKLTEGGLSKDTMKEAFTVNREAYNRQAYEPDVRYRL